MILSGKEIQRRLHTDIIIEPFNPKQLGPNSYNLRLHHELMTYAEPLLDMKQNHKVNYSTIPDEGLILQPGHLYLGRTVEYTKTESLVPMLEGRSSIGRLGLFVHITAGFGDVGFSGFWTLEMYCVQPIRIYPNVELCQIFYHTIEGDFTRYESNKYQNNKGIQPSMLYKDFQPSDER
jgi:dCTP deaminase